MRGSFFLGDKTFRTQTIPERELAEGEVLLKVAACGVCGTDVHIYHGSQGSAEVHPPVILGHEFAGTIVKTGPGVDGLSVGDHVTVDPNIYCGKCHFCQIGKKQLCRNLQAIGVTMNGGFAEYCYVPQSQCFRLEPQVPLRYGAMAEPLACCLHGIDRVGIKAGDTVCVIGGGAIGLMMVQLAKMSGASRVILSEPVDYRRKVGIQLGADGTIDPLREDITKKLIELLGTEGADVVIECVGNTTATAQAFHAAKAGAAVLLFSVPKTGTHYQMSLDDVYQKELRIVGSRINPDTHGRAVELINNSRIELDPIITHSYSVDCVEEAILKQMADDSIKVVVEP